MKSVAVTWSQTGLSFLSYAHVALILAWGIAGIISGFANGILHVTPIVFEILLVKIMADSLGIARHRSIVLVCVLLVVAICLNVTHLVFTAIELGECTSVLCLNTYWFLFVFAFILGFLAVLEGILFYYFIWYSKNLRRL